MITVKQNGKPRVVMTGGKVIAEFENGTAEVDKATADVLAALGYEVVPEPAPGDAGGADGSQTGMEGQIDGNTDAGGETPAENSGNKRSGRGKSA